MDPFENRAKLYQQRMFAQIADCSTAAKNIESELKNTQSSLHKMIMSEIGDKTSAYFILPITEIPENIRSDVKVCNSCHSDENIATSKYLRVKNNQCTQGFKCKYASGLRITYNCKGI